MRLQFVSDLSNVRLLVNTAKRLESNEAGAPGMALCHGYRGLGKTRAAIWYAAGNRAIYLRSKNRWTPSWMLEELALELQLAPRRRMKDLFGDVENALKGNPRLVMVDEVNIPPISCLETLRDIHDITENPFLFLGHDGVIQRLKPLAPLFDRFLYISEFKPLGLDDIKAFAASCMELPVNADTLGKVLKVTQGNLRKTVVVLKGMENRAKAARAAEITCDHLPREGKP